ncbi:MAG TPA: amidohydrolase family protein [Burkholderiales bacterium]|nr:amidohydrolase family protein [Burkholderiales bacterium]
MITRTKAVRSSGIAFTDCAVTNAARAKQPAAKRREVVIKGRRVKTIDVHAHCVIPEAMEVMGRTFAPPTLVIAEDRLRVMDRQGIDMEALSINPFWYAAERDVATKVVQIQNEKLSELCATYPDRFVAFASVALQYPELAVQQLEHAVRNLGLRGAAVGASVAGSEFSDPKFHPFWQKVEELGVLIFLHPQSTPDLARRLKGNGVLENVIGNPLDTTIALSHLIFEGTLDRFPRLKICAAHGGGYLASYAPRSDHGCLVFPERCDPNIKLKKKPTQYLRKLYFDSLVFTSEALRHLAAEVGSSQIVLGTDYPFPWQDKSVEHVLKTPSLTDAERIAILGTTAAKLLGIKIDTKAGKSAANKKRGAKR